MRKNPKGLKEEPGHKNDSGKLRMDLLPAEAIEGMARVLTMGGIQYGDRNWENGISWTRIIGSLKRHLTAFEKRDDIDPQWGLHHLDHLLANAAFLRHFAAYSKYRKFDDRPDHGSRTCVGKSSLNDAG